MSKEKRKRHRHQPDVADSTLVEHPVRALSLALALLTFAIYCRALSNDFIRGYDDRLYVLENETVQSGLTLSGLTYAFTEECASNWHPLTMISHMLDCEIFGLIPWGHHLTNIALHTANVVLLFLCLYRMTGARWHSATVALLFAIHPIHVQSVAHVAQRKDVLSAFFWILTLMAYTSYAHTKAKRAYLLALGAFTLGLMSKPILVTLPLLLLLLDYWPLNRLDFEDGRRWPRAVWPLLLEKIPFIIVSIAFSVITFLVQYASEAVESLEYRPISLRLANAAIAYVSYIRKLMWPADLALHYPYPDAYPAWKIGAAAATLAVISIVAAWQLRKRPYLIVGWLWFLISMLPMIGIVQVGAQAMADRYAYMTFVGLYLIVAWGGWELLRRLEPARLAAGVAIAISATALAAFTWIELGYWKDAESLWRRALEVTTDNATAHSSLGVLLANQSRARDDQYIRQALEHTAEAVRIDPAPRLLINLGNILLQAERFDEAEAAYEKAIAIAPEYSSGHYHLGLLTASQGRTSEAETHFKRADDGTAKFHVVVGNIFSDHGDTELAEHHYREALKRDPSFAAAHYNLGRLYERLGDLDSARDAYQAAGQRDPTLEVESDIGRIGSNAP